MASEPAITRLHQPDMAHLVTFRTRMFGPRAEPANPIHPIAGHAVLVWLRSALQRASFESGEPDAEDWGWYVDISGRKNS